MGIDRLAHDYEISLIPREFKFYSKFLDINEITILHEEMLKAHTLNESIPYMDFSKRVLNLVLTSTLKLPNLEYLAANIAFDIRRLDDLEKVVNKSENIFTVIPLIKGLIAKNSLARAAANIRIVETNISHDDFVYQIEFYLAKAEYSIAIGNLTDGLFHILSAKEYLTSLDEQLDKFFINSLTEQILAVECKILLEMGRYDKVFDIVNDGLSLAKELGNEVYEIFFELYYGNYLIEYLNDIENGNQHHRRAAYLAKNLMNPFHIAFSLETIGSNLRLQRNLEEGIKFCKHAEQLYKKINDEQSRMAVVSKIANLQIAFGNLATATARLLELETLGSKNPKTYLNLVYAFIKSDELDLAENYLEKSRKFLRGRSDLPGEFCLIYYEGMIEFQSGNFSKSEYLFANAQEFAELSKLPRQTILAGIQLVRVLVTKNVAYPSKRNYKKARYAIIDLASQLETDKKSIEYNELELLKAILLFSSKNYSDAKIIFKQLEKFYLEFRLYDQITIVQDYLNRIDHFENLGIIIEPLIKETFTVFDDTTKPAFKPRIDPSTSFIDLGANPILLLILSQSGLPLYSHYFTEVYGSLDETLVSGFLGAVVSFTEKIGESKNGPSIKRGFLQGIRHGDFEILLERTDHYIIALVADKENYLLRKQLKRLADEINVLFLIDEEPMIIMGEKNRYLIQSIINKIF
ncbi:MAG: hypothetical protein JXA54_02185 [Candidatus Heimdallarchaeota archaeon]|nr:hypothetical protein [Candidatus Heimdallarchaeota archaeon]